MTIDDYPFTKVRMFSDGGFKEYEFQELETCSSVKDYLGLQSQINIATSKQTVDGKQSKLILKIHRPTGISTFFIDKAANDIIVSSTWVEPEYIKLLKAIL